jgi:hypothetical protein
MRSKSRIAVSALALMCVGMAAQAAYAANVKITPLGSHDGEFCLLDRAMIFEDPDGTRLLYDRDARCAVATTRGSGRSTGFC